MLTATSSLRCSHVYKAWLLVTGPKSGFQVITQVWDDDQYKKDNISVLLPDDQSVHTSWSVQPVSFDAPVWVILLACLASRDWNPSSMSP